MRKGLALLALPILLAHCTTAPPQQQQPQVSPTFDQARIDAVRRTMNREDVSKALAFVDRDRATIMQQWRELTEIPAPSGHEAKRADWVENLLRTYGMADVHRDAAGNVIATWKGDGGGHRVAFDAHLDTVFPLTTNVTTRIEGDRIYGAGVGDDTRNVIALLAMIRAMSSGRVLTMGDIMFVFSVEEETNFRGVNQFLADHGKSIHRYVALDGGYRGFTYGGIGTYWSRYHFLGPGGHTRSENPPYSATLPAARAIDRLYALEKPGNVWFNVGMLGAGDVFNAKASDAWFSVDLRSNDAATLTRLDGEVARIAREEAERAGMTLRREDVSLEPVASIPGHRNSEMVRQAEAVWRAFDFDPPITDTASNHSSAALRAGIPAIGTGVTPCGASHSVDEWCEIEPIFTGIKRNIVLAVVLAE